MAKSLRRQLREISLEGAYSAEENARLILDERTRNLAARGSAGVGPKAASTDILVCRAGTERYGISLSDIAEIVPEQTCVPVPDGPPALVGLLGRRGHLVSVIDLGAALGAPPPPPEARFSHFVMLRRDHPRIALRVEEAQGVQPAAHITLDDAPVFRSNAVVGYAAIEADAAGDGHVVSLLDVESLIRPFLSPSPVSGD